MRVRACVCMSAHVYVVALCSQDYVMLIVIKLIPDVSSVQLVRLSYIETVGHV